MKIIFLGQTYREKCVKNINLDSISKIYGRYNLKVIRTKQTLI